MSDCKPHAPIIYHPPSDSYHCGACGVWLVESTELERLQGIERDYNLGRKALPDDPPEGYTFGEAIRALRRSHDKSTTLLARIRDARTCAALDSGGASSPLEVLEQIETWINER